MVFADKTANMYKMSKKEYAKLINHNATKTYQNITKSTKKKIDKESKHFAKKLKLENKMEQDAYRSTYVMLKDRKENFKANLLHRSINLAKSESGIVSKVELENINRAITNQITGTQRRNTQATIDWFKSIPNKTKARFTKFDIVGFYPSITEKLLENAVSFAQTLIIIPDNIIQLVKQARKSHLFTEGNIWMKKCENGLFDFTIGLHDGAEVCELASIYLLGKLSNTIDKENFGLFRDTGCLLLKIQMDPNLIV